MTMAAYIAESGIGIHSVSFSPETVEVSFYDLDQNEGALVHEIRTLSIPQGLAESELADVHEALCALITQAYQLRRKPKEPAQTARVDVPE